MNRAVTRGFIRQINTLTTADATANAVERIVSRAWSELLAAIRSIPDGPFVFAHLYPRFRAILAPLADRLATELHGRLQAQAADAYEDTADAIADHASVASLTAAAGLQEADGMVSVGRTIIDNAAGLIGLDADAAKEYLKSLIFPPPPKEVINRIVFGGDWYARLAEQTKLGNPATLAQIVANNFAQGKSTRDLAKSILPHVDGVRHVARRIARDESMRTSHAMQMQAYDQLGPVCVGFTVHAVMDAATRPEHRERDGWQYFKNPKSGQRGLDQMPQPPKEADGSHSYNCRCFLSPITDLDAVDATPNIQALGDWFDGEASDRERIMAVGAVRYQFVESALGRKPYWSDFTDVGGELMDLPALQIRFARAA